MGLVHVPYPFALDLLFNDHAGTVNITCPMDAMGMAEAPIAVSF